MEAVIHVDNLAYCKLEIEDAVLPASMNLVDNIILQEGMGIAVPTLTLYLMDQTGSLQTDMNLVQGTKCSISIAKKGMEDNIIKRNFSLWGMKRVITAAGPQIHAVFTMDIPKWMAGVYCENFRATSAEAMQQLAGRSGLRYDGPSSTDDKMNWLNVNTTRASFSEDVAMRGYANSSSCMNRVVTLDSELRYKDIFEELQGEAIATLLLNMDHEGENNPFYVQETRESSSSGVMAHWFNFGAIQHEHTLDQKGQQITDRILAPVMGDSFPISDRIKGLISDAAAARVTYTGFDPGTEPNEQSNVHEYYERAFYQNLRSLGLFSERLRSMVQHLTDIKTFDCITYKQADPTGGEMMPSKTLNGKYLVAGKTIRIKNGHAYTETLDLIRPYVNNPGKSEQASGTDSNKKVKANANEDLSSETEKKLDTAIQNQEQPVETNKPKKTEVKRATDLMDAVEEFDKVVPRIPDGAVKSPGTMSPSDPQAVAQDKVRNALEAVHSDNNEVSDKVNEGKAGFDPEQSHTVKRISASAVKSSANSTVDAMQKQTEDTGIPPNGPEGLTSNARSKTSVKLEKPVMDRYSGTGTEIKEEKFTSAITPQSAADMNVGDSVGDLQKGGVFTEDFLSQGEPVPAQSLSVASADYSYERLKLSTANSSISLGLKSVDAIEKEEKKGTNFVFPASKFGLSGEDVSIKPQQVAKFLLEFAKEREDPKAFLRKKGAAAYEASFGAVSPTEAKASIEELKRAAVSVNEKWGTEEVIAEPGPETKTPNFITESPIAEAQGTPDKATEQRRKLKSIKDELGEKSPGVTIKDSQTGFNKDPFSKSGLTQIVKRDVKQKIKGGTNPDYAKGFDFQFGESGVSPLVERVISKGRDQNYTGVEIVETQREAKSWAIYMRIGSDEAKKQQQQYPEQDDVHWEFPDVMPFKKYEEGEGDANDFSDEPGAI